MEEIQENKNKIITECGHVFHTSCLMKNASHNGFGCPYCRTKMADEPEADEDEEDGYYEDDEEEYEYVPDYNNYVLSGARWLFQRAEGEELDDDINDANPEEEPQEDDVEEEEKPTAEYITDRLQNMYGITMEDVIRSLLFIDHHEYESESSFKSTDSKVFNLTRRIIEQFSDERNEVV
jgi:hypothetical protein